MPPHLAFGPQGPTAATDAPWHDPLRRADWDVRPIAHADARAFVEAHHYALGMSKTAVARYGLYARACGTLAAVSVWLPPGSPAAARSFLAAPDAPRRVLALSRLVAAPWAPRYASGHLVARSATLLPDRWDVLCTYAHEGLGHVGTVYQAVNFTYLGTTPPANFWVDAQGRMVSDRAGSRTLTRLEMLERGCVLRGKTRKHRYRFDRRDPEARNPHAYPKRHHLLFNSSPVEAE
ncbi:hypothetical protein [Deinococcus soli (ex Cha et al. 2016)]|uniref:Uncharacterized protein n=2 Tax=Deinococcus soli (ex Cha et al. 2016) TaxID=1309411 RepID=A0AAE4BN10_9DEIO|nr:hypothetical protein [Deinococcus soli (ex Cha et al. 2016)]MDR6218241.1 hypothetical protein [Deinococcus soli (ex Cha et al. 2016)]MDR6328981.1 hypothetical protein [Deinococcus soli (ex Cha et al. 2016)]MDR6751254.1 hypothetical protein [Deinococcus soli (ex Cha et al. 2016)]